VPEVHVCRYPTTKERSDGRGYQGDHNPMRAGGTRTTPCYYNCYPTPPCQASHQPHTPYVIASDSEVTPRPIRASVCRRYTFPGIPRQRSGSDGRGALGAHNPMRAGGTRITPWLMLLTGFRCRYASATLVLWFWYALTCGWCGLRRFVVSWRGNCGG
jgi:hypothetical protein